MKTFIKEEFQKQQIPNEELEEQIHQTTQNPFQTNSANKKKELKEFSKL
jgi:hypothetical protein